MASKEQNGLPFGDVVYLAACAVREVAPDPNRVREMDLDMVYREAERQLLASCCAFALESIGACTEDFEQAKAVAIRKAVLMDIQRREVVSKLEESGIWYLPLKGTVIKNYYPSVGMREMSDNDILFDTSRTDDMRLIMANLGFRGDHFDRGAHDCFYKDPIYNFEMHHVLFNDWIGERLNPYYGNITERLISDGDSCYGYRFTPEDFYLYMVAHEYKHYLLSGTGLRGCFDTYVYLSKEPLDMEYVRREAEVMEIADFEQINRSLSLHLVNGEALTESEEYLFSYMCKSGVYGGLEAKVGHWVSESGGGVRGGLRYVLRRIFPTMDQIKSWYPTVYRHRILLPLIPFFRIGKALTMRRGKALDELKALCKK